MIGALLQILGSIGLALARAKAGTIAIITFLGSAFFAILSWVLTHWGRWLLVRMLIFAAWIALVTAACNLLNNLISSLVQWTFDISGLLSLVDLSGTWLRGVLFGILQLDYLWRVLVDCFGLWLGCHSFRMLYHRFIWAQKFTAIRT